MPYFNPWHRFGDFLWTSRAIWLFGFERVCLHTLALLFVFSNIHDLFLLLMVRSWFVRYLRIILGLLKPSVWAYDELCEAPWGWKRELCPRTRSTPSMPIVIHHFHLQAFIFFFNFQNTHQTHILNLLTPTFHTLHGHPRFLQGHH